MTNEIIEELEKVAHNLEMATNKHAVKIPFIARMDLIKQVTELKRIINKINEELN